jgi:hypothetical protein
MRQTIMVVLMIVAFVSGMGLRGWWESEALAKSCLTPDWCEDYNTCTQLGCQPIGTVDGCIAEDCVVCCEFTRTKYDCNGDGAPDCNDYHFLSVGCGDVKCLPPPQLCDVVPCP